MLLKYWFRLGKWLLLLLLLLALALYLYCLRSSANSSPEPEVTAEEVQLEITERLRLITQRIDYRKQLYIRAGRYSAEGVADLVAYSKFDLEQLKVSKGVGDTIYLSLPEPQVELGRRLGGKHSIKYYEYSPSLLGGMQRSATSNRAAVQRLDDSIMSRAYRDILADSSFLPEARREARARLQQLVQSLYSQHHIIVTEEILLPGVEYRTASPQ